jgi:hypothetical protein
MASPRSSESIVDSGKHKGLSQSRINTCAIELTKGWNPICQGGAMRRQLQIVIGVIGDSAHVPRRENLPLSDD